MSDYQQRVKEERASLLDRTMKLFGIIMILAYVALGVALILYPNGLLKAPSKFTIPAGALLIVYGGFRGYRLYRDFFKR